VKRGEVLAEVETDKANMELEAFVAGVLLEIRVEPGEMVAVGTVIAVIGSPEEKQPAGETKQPPKGVEAKAPSPEPTAQQEGAAGAAEAQAPGGENAAPGGEPAQAESQAPAAPVTPKSEQPQQPAQPEAAETAKDKAPLAPPPPEAGKPATQAPAGQPAESRERAAPVVRRRARELGVDLATVKGSGPDGRILLQDLEGAQQKPGAGTPAAEPSKPAAAAGLSRLRAAIAKNVSESWRAIPHFTVTVDILMDDAEVMRRQLKQSGKAVTLTDLVVKASALALGKYPQLNASLADDQLQQHADVNICVAVAVPDGVLMPVISRCQDLSLQEIAEASHAIAEKARSGGLSEQAMSGGTFAVSNLGMYGVTQFTAIIFPSHSAVLAVGSVLDTVVARNGAPVCAKVMKVTISADHRVVDGAYAAQFLAEFKEILETPIRLLL
jgi:pyruvate dehydrogenase E2 component (dihydrolipoamide acetyltransferase)